MTFNIETWTKYHNINTHGMELQCTMFVSNHATLQGASSMGLYCIVADNQDPSVIYYTLQMIASLCF